MGRDNQDYFKRGGRSEGPPGPLRHFRERLGQQQAELSRGEGRKFPGARRAAPPPPRPTPEEESPATTSPANAPTEASARPPPQSNGASNGASEAPAERAGRPASEAPFGPPASEEFAEGLRSGVQRTDGEEKPLGAPWAALVRRFPRLSRAFARVGRLPEKPAQKLAALGRRVERAFESRGH